jgi:hypothetical protein
LRFSLPNLLEGKIEFFTFVQDRFPRQIAPNRLIQVLEAHLVQGQEDKRIGEKPRCIASFAAERAPLAELMLKLRLPGVYGTKEIVEAGGLISYSADFHDSIRRVASYIDKILKGAKPADLPVEQASKYVLVINLKTAKVLDITVPPLLLARADEVIE